MQVTSGIHTSRPVSTQRRRTVFVTVGLAAALTVSACTAPAGSGDASPPAPAHATPSTSSAPTSGDVAGLAWPDGSPFVATTVDTGRAPEVTGTTEIGRFPVYQNPTNIPMSLNSDGTVVVSRYAGGGGGTWGGNDAVTVWDGTMGPFISSVDVMGEGSRGISDALVDGTTLVWRETVGDTGSIASWYIYAAPLDGSGKVRLLAQSDDLGLEDLSWDLGSGRLVVVDGRAYYSVLNPGPDGTSPYALFSVPLTGGDLRLEVPQSADLVLGADGIIVARTEVEEKGAWPNTLLSATGLDLVAPGKDPRPLVTFEHSEGASTFTEMMAAGDHVVVMNENSLVVLDPAATSALRVVPPAGSTLGSVGACDDRVIWAVHGPDIGGEPQFEAAEWFILTPSTGAVARHTGPSSGGRVLCAGEFVMVTETAASGDGAQEAVVLQVPRG